MENEVKVAVVGAGYWGKNLIRNFNALGVLAAICDNRKDVLEAFLKTYPHVFTTDSFQAVFENPAIRAIAIASPAEMHYRMVKEGLLADKEVFVEKPLALHENEGVELYELAEQRKKILMVGHLLQYHPAVIKLKQLVSEGELGKVQYVYSNRLNLGKIRREENTNVYNPRSYIPRKNEIRPTLVREAATLGANSTIVCGHTIGKFAFVGAGAVVLDDVPDHALIAGNPAKIKGWMCQCGIRLHFDKKGNAVCDACGLEYQKKANQVALIDTE